MAFIDHIQGRDLQGFFFCRVSGLPYLFSSVALPASWKFGGGEQISFHGELYDWSVSMLIDDMVATLSQKLAPKAGVVTNGSMPLKFAYAGDGLRAAVDDPWLSLLLNNLGRTDGRLWTTLTSNISPDSVSSFNVVNNAWAGFLQLYIGLETLITNPGAGTSTNIPINARGAYGSHAVAHVHASRSPNVEIQSNGVTVSDFPLSMEGRVLEFYFVPCDKVAAPGGRLALRPKGAPSSDDVATAYAGLISGIDEGGDLLTFDLETVSIQGLLNVPACSFHPEAEPYSATFNENLEVERVYVGPHNDRFHVQVSYNGAASEPFFYINDNSVILNNDTITIGGVVYTFKTVPAAAPALEILIGVNAEDTANQCVITMALADLAAGVNVAGGWRVVRALSRMVFYSATAGDPSAVAISVSNPAAITLSAPNASRLGNIEAFDIPFGTPADLQAPFYQVGWVAIQLQAALAPLIGIPNFSVYQGWKSQGAGKAPRLRLSFAFPGYEQLISELGGVTIKIIPSVGGGESVLRDLGFTKTVEGSSPDGGGVFDVIANKSPAQFRWPGPAFTAPERLFLGNYDSFSVINAFFGGSEFDGQGTSWEDDDGNQLPMVVRLGKLEMIEGPQQPSNQIPGYLYYYMEVSERGVYNGLTAKEIYIEVAAPDKIKPIKATRVPAFTNTSAERMILYLMLGGSGKEGTNDPDYDAGWRGAGANINPRLVDVPSLEAYAALGANVRDNWCILPGDMLNKIIEGEGLVMQQFLTINNGLFTMIDLLPVSESEASNALSIGAGLYSSSRAVGGVGFDRKENRICNVAQTKINFNNATGRFDTEVEASQLESVSRYGEKRPINLEVRGLADPAGAAQLAASVVQNIFANHAQPNVLVDLSICSFIMWSSSIGDLVNLTHSTILSYRKPGRGVEDMPCRVRAIGKAWMGTGGAPDGGRFARVTLASDAFNGARSSEWAPTAYLTVSGDGGATWQVIADEFGPGGAVKDIDSFKVGWRVLVSPLSDLRRATATEHTITSIDSPGSLVGLSPSFVGAPKDAFMWLAPYDDTDTGDEERSRIYWSDGTGRLTSPDGVDLAFVYV